MPDPLNEIQEEENFPKMKRVAGKVFGGIIVAIGVAILVGAVILEGMQTVDLNTGEISPYMNGFLVWLIGWGGVATIAGGAWVIHWTHRD